MNANKYDVHLVDVSARDGLQNEPNAAALSATDKALFIRMLAQAGLTRIEAGSFVHPKVATMANSDEVAMLLKSVEKDFPDVIFSYLVPNLKGLERARSAHAKEVAVFLAISEEFSKANINQPVDDAFANIAPVIESARKSCMRVRGYLSNIFGYTDLPFLPKEVARRSKQLLDMGCFEVSLGDTTGIGTPEMTAELILALKTANVPITHVAMHFHDTNGRAIANVETSYELGIRAFDAATGGLGGCPYANSPKGNLAMETLVEWCRAKRLRISVRDLDGLRKAAAFMLAKLGKSAT